VYLSWQEAGFSHHTRQPNWWSVHQRRLATSCFPPFRQPPTSYKACVYGWQRQASSFKSSNRLPPKWSHDSCSLASHEPGFESHRAYLGHVRPSCTGSVTSCAKHSSVGSSIASGMAAAITTGHPTSNCKPYTYSGFVLHYKSWGRILELHNTDIHIHLFHRNVHAINLKWEAIIYFMLINKMKNKHYHNVWTIPNQISPLQKVAKSNITITESSKINYHNYRK
jgi:hypothetical protein